MILNVNKEIQGMHKFVVAVVHQLEMLIRDFQRMAGCTYWQFVFTREHWFHRSTMPF